MWIGVGALPLAWACLGTTHFLSDVCSYVTALELRRGSSQTFAGVVLTEKTMLLLLQRRRFLVPRGFLYRCHASRFGILLPSGGKAQREFDRYIF
jgi:hypothetical protein